MCVDLIIIGEIYQHRDASLQEMKRMEYGARHQQLLQSYEAVLMRHGIDPVTDAAIYKQMMKIDMKVERGATIFDAL